MSKATNNDINKAVQDGDLEKKGRTPAPLVAPKPQATKPPATGDKKP